MTYRPVERNLAGVEHEALRRQVDGRFNAAHDDLSAAYYERRAFVWRGRDYGVLDKATFDQLHGLVFLLRDVAMHERNQAMRVHPEADEQLRAMAVTAQATIANLSAAGVTLEV